MTILLSLFISSRSGVCFQNVMLFLTDRLKCEKKQLCQRMSSDWSSVWRKSSAFGLGLSSTEFQSSDILYYLYHSYRCITLLCKCNYMKRECTVHFCRTVQFCRIDRAILQNRAFLQNRGISKVMSLSCWFLENNALWIWKLKLEHSAKMHSLRSCISCRIFS